MHETELLLLGLLVFLPGLTVLARAVDVPYPIALVLGGLALGLVPGVPEVALEPELVLVIFLPPLLYVAAFFANLRDLRADVRGISLLAVGLVLFTTVAVAVLAHAAIDGLPWAAAFALGAIVSPTDPLAATTIARRLGAPRRIVSVIEGESLVNDATALVAYRVAAAAAIGGSFSLWEAGLRFVLAAGGGVLVGLAIAWLVAQARRRLDDPPVEITISLFTGYAAFFPAEQLGLSGVLAAVTAGIYLGWRAPEISSARMRVQGYAVWEFVVFLLNALLFMLIGLQLPRVLDGLGDRSPATLALYAALVCGTVLATRMVWVFALPAMTRALEWRRCQVGSSMPTRERLVVVWGGMRGAVSLAAALSLPLQTAAGAPFPERDLIIFLTFAVILTTLVFQGLTLPALIRHLGVRDDGSEEESEELHARLTAVDAALERLQELSQEEWVREDTTERLRAMYDYRRRRFGARAGHVDDDGYEERSEAYQRLLAELLDAQRTSIVALRNQGLISNDVMHRIQRELDLEEGRLENDPASRG